MGFTFMVDIYTNGDHKKIERDMYVFSGYLWSLRIWTLRKPTWEFL